jgi:molybdate transport system ATP-binding protein
MLHVEIRQASPIQLDARFSCRNGETLVLVGPSGSGKSTILKTIAGVYRPAGGRIQIDAEVWFDSATGIHVPARRRRAGLVFQSYALFPHLSVLSNVLEAVPPGPHRRRVERAGAVLASVKLTGLESRRPAQLSGGQQQRVALARALAREPAVLLLDEPFSAVDQATRERLYEELANLRRLLKMPVVLVTHSLQEALLLADQMCVLHHGTTLQTGTPQEVMTRPRSVEVARLVSLKNICTATVRAHDAAADRTILDWNGLQLEAGLQAHHPVGAVVSWVVPSGAILLHRQDRPSHGERENPVPCEVLRCVAMGDMVQLTLAPIHSRSEHLATTLSVHVAARNRVKPGEPAVVSLLTSGIHLLSSPCPKR